MGSSWLRLLKSRRAWVVAIVVGLGAVLLWHLTAYPRGMLMGYFDHARGHYEVKVFGGPPLSPQDAELHAAYAHLLKERYGVELNVIGGCVVPEGYGRYVAGYSEVSRRLLTEKHGRDIFAECWGLAQRLKQ